MSDISQLLIHLLACKICNHKIRWKTIYHTASHLCRDSGSVCSTDILSSSATSSLTQNLVNLCLKILIICRVRNRLIDNNIRCLNLYCVLVSICICKRLRIRWNLLSISLVLLWLIFPIIFIIWSFF
jgi:hypothetical protein